MPVVTCGGMRFQSSWTAGATVSAAQQAKLEATVRRALDLGVCHVETARGYGTSEEQLGRILPDLPRHELIVQTKVEPTEDPAQFVRQVEDSMRRLHLEHVDLLALHGLNDQRMMDLALRDGGCLEAAVQLRDRGLTRHVGFSTHAPLELLLRGISDARFEYVNLHYYYVFQENQPALTAAAARDLGVLIISPNDKGGRLYAPSSRLVALTRPLSPMAYNDLFCWLHPEIHTLSVGASGPSDFEEHARAAELLVAPDTAAVVSEITARLDAAYEDALGRDWARGWSVGIPRWQDVPGRVNAREILRLYNLARAFDMIEYGRARYGLLGNGGHWHPGRNAAALDEAALRQAFAGSPFPERVVSALREAHVLFGDRPVRRLQREP
jgi:predicted aldo/keto reductase-like oxidoreductase